MSSQSDSKRAQKHDPGAQPNAAIKAEIERYGKNNQIPCAVAFKIVENLGVPPSEVGKNTDLIDFELVKCQLGLFGYTPNKRIVKPKDTPQQEIKDAIASELVNERLPCKSAWEIAGRFKVPKLTISNVCETIGVKIKPCQLGAF
jgi:hypothetical protein